MPFGPPAAWRARAYASGWRSTSITSKGMFFCASLASRLLQAPHQFAPYTVTELPSCHPPCAGAPEPADGKSENATTASQGAQEERIGSRLARSGQARGRTALSAPSHWAYTGIHLFLRKGGSMRLPAVL